MSSWKRGGFVVTLVAAKVIRQHVFVSYIVIYEIIIKKRNYILSYEYHDRWPNITPVHFCWGFDHANVVSSFLGSKHLLKN